MAAISFYPNRTKLSSLFYIFSNKAFYLLCTAHFLKQFKPSGFYLTENWIWKRELRPDSVHWITIFSDSPTAPDLIKLCIIPPGYNPIKLRNTGIQIIFYPLSVFRRSCRNFFHPLFAFQSEEAPNAFQNLIYFQHAINPERWPMPNQSGQRSQRNGGHP